MLSRRAVLASSLATIAFPGFARADGVPNAVVGEVPDGIPDGARRFPTLTAALAAAPDNNDRYIILIGQGTFTEKVVIKRAKTTIYGLNPTLTRIVWDDYSGRAGPDGYTLGTRRTATLTILATDVTLQNLSIVNSFDYLGQIALPEGDPKKVHDTQALALAVSGGADRVRLDNVDLQGWQDTLFVDAGRALIRNSRISGSVDFIFGAGTAALDHCEIVSRLMPGKPGQGYVCAPSTLKRTPYGFVFFDCELTHEGEPFPDGSVALARPWRPTTSFPDGRYGNPDVWSACLYLRCAFGDHISGKGFDHMSYNAKGGTKAFNEPEDARFYISGCTGKAVATIPARFTAPDALVAGLTPETLLGTRGWDL
jgi:pectinesterase